MLEDGDGIDLVQCYNPRTDTWIDKPNMQIARSGSAACVLDGLIYVIGSVNCILSKKTCMFFNSFP